MADSDADQELADRYRSYLALCNAGELDALGDYVADELRVNGETVRRAAYAAAIGEVRAAFPDFRWEIEHLVVNRPLLAARLIGTGTHTGGEWSGLVPARSPVRVPEHALYAWSAGRIREVWSLSDRLDTLHQLGGTAVVQPER